MPPACNTFPYWSPSIGTSTLSLRRSSIGCQSISKNEAYRLDVPFSCTSHQYLFSLPNDMLFGKTSSTCHIFTSTCFLQMCSCHSASSTLPSTRIYTLHAH